jgi:hypothetical protein
MPSHVIEGIKLTPVISIEEIIEMSFVTNTSGGEQNGPR